MGGRLEHEIRLLPQVLSCSFSKDDHVVVLTDPSADPWKIQLSVERILQDDGSEATVRVIGPHDAVAIAATRTISPLVATATVATIAAIGIGALVGSLAAAQHPKVQPTRKTPVAIATAAPFDSIDALRGLQFSVRHPAVPQPTVQQATIQPPVAPAARVSVETPDRTGPVLPVSVGATAVIRRPSTSPRFRPFQARATGTSPPASSVRATPPEHRGHHGRRLPHWSEVLLPPHPNKQRGQAD
jgi:hypothetical protein